MGPPPGRERCSRFRAPPGSAIPEGPRHGGSRRADRRPPREGDGVEMRRLVRRQALAGVLAVAGVATALVLGSAGGGGAQGPKTLVIAIGADQTGLDPQTVQNNESGFIMATIYDSIVNYKPGSSEVGPGLAESWTVSPDGKVDTFKLRRNVKFHDGTPMNARTVADDIDPGIHPGNPCYVLNHNVRTLRD